MAHNTGDAIARKLSIASAKKRVGTGDVAKLKRTRTATNSQIKKMRKYSGLSYMKYKKKMKKSTSYTTVDATLAKRAATKRATLAARVAAKKHKKEQDAYKK